jgi:hypothetical protein
MMEQETEARGRVVPSARLRVRAQTVNGQKIPKRQLRAEGEAYPPEINACDPKPATYGECEARGLGTVARCPYVSCKYHLALEVSPQAGSIRTIFPDRDPDAVPATCALGVAARGEHTLEQVGAIMNITRERVRQLEDRALAKLARAVAARRLDDD